MAVFPDTPKTLIKKIAEFANGNDNAVWKELIELYAPPLKVFVRLHDSQIDDAEADDVVQEVFIQLVDLLRR